MNQVMPGTIKCFSWKWRTSFAGILLAVLLSIAPSVSVGADASIKELLEFLTSPERYIKTRDCRHLYKQSKTSEDLYVTATICGDREAVVRLFDSGVNVDAWHSTDPKKRSALHRASGEGNDIEILELLLSRGAEVNKIAGDGSTPLESAAWYGKAKNVQLLLAGGANPNISGYHGGPLHAAVGGGHLEVVKLLLKAGADPNLRIPTIGVEPGGTPLHRHSWRGVWPTFPAILDLLIKNGADINAKTDKGKTPLDFAERGSFLPLLKAGATVGSGKQDDIIFQAMRVGAANAVDYLLEMGYPLHSPAGASSLLHKAVSNYWLYDESIPMLLLAHGADPHVPDQNEWTAFELASRNCYTKTVERIIGAGKRSDINLAKIVDRSNEVSSSASVADCVKVLRLLVRAGVEIEKPGIDGKSPLILSIRNDFLAKELLELGALPNAADNTRRSALHYSVISNPRLIKPLLDVGADPNSQDKDGNTPLHLLAKEQMKLIPVTGIGRDQYPINNLLPMFGKGARVDIKNREGLTPLEITKLIEAELKAKGQWTSDLEYYGMPLYKLLRIHQSQ